jgi:hypothetical protein
VACSDVLSMRVTNVVRAQIEQEQASLESDRRLSRAHAGDPTTMPLGGTRHRAGSLAHACGMALGAVTATIWDARAHVREHMRRP